MNTKEKILLEALTLFAEKGYEAVSVGQIAGAVGIKAPSLYKHYKSKQDIFNGILSQMEEQYRRTAEAMQLNGSEPGADEKMFLNLPEEQLVQLGTGLFLYFLHDDAVCKFRKMLTIEQYGNRELAALYTKQYVDDPLAYQSGLFALLVQAGLLVGEAPDVMALHFYAPIQLLLTLCDRQPQREPEALSLLERHIRQFDRLYRKGGERS